MHLKLEKITDLLYETSITKRPYLSKTFIFLGERQDSNLNMIPTLSKMPSKLQSLTGPFYSHNILFEYIGNDIPQTKKGLTYVRPLVLGERRDSNPRPSEPQTDTLTS